MKFISLLTLCLLNFSVLGAIPVQALPGETPETVTKKFYSNSFFRGLKLGQSCLAAGCNLRRKGIFSMVNGSFLETDYLSFNPSIFRGYKFFYRFDVNLDRKIVYSESLQIENLNSQDSGKYENKNYDFRIDSLITEVMNKVWGQSLADDFKNARYTDTFTGGGRGGVTRQIYDGKKFAYQIVFTKDQIIGIDVIIPEYIKTLRILSEMEERL